MRGTAPEPVTIEVTDAQQVSGLLQLPASAKAAYVFAHGAGAGMDHVFMETMAQGLAARGIGSLRYQFPFMENGSRRPDGPALAHATIRAAVHCACQRLPGLPLFAGGKSFGGRMTSQAQAAEPLPGVLGLVFVGFPLHPAGKPSQDRAEHLAQVACPMLFLQGTRDKLAEEGLIQSVVGALGKRATLALVRDADHAFHVPVRSGRNDQQALSEMLDVMVRWMSAQVHRR